MDGGLFTETPDSLVDCGTFKIELIDGGIFPGMSINKSIEILEVGENFSAMATIYPYDVMDSNIVEWETSNPEVCTINYGVIEGISQGTSTITAYDPTRIYSKSFKVEVKEPITQTIAPTDIYYVTASRYDIYLDNTHSTETTNGIINALTFAKSMEYKKIVFPYGTYLVTPMAGTVNFPSNMIIDFNNSKINIEISTKTSTGYEMFKLDNVQYTKFINAHVYGERDFTTIAGSHEDCVSLLIGDAYKSGIELCTFSKSPGFNVKTSTKRMKDGTGDAWFTYSNFEPGNIDNSGVNDDNIVTYHFRTPNFVDISRLGNYFMVGYNQGYWDYRFLRSRLYSIYFYDINHQFIEVQPYNWQYYCYDKPQNAYYAKIVVYQDTAPNSGDTDYKDAVAFIRTLGIPRKCFIKNSILSDSWTSGLAMTGGQDWTISGNSFSGNGGRLPGCDIVWEDGWDAMVGDIVKNNTFDSTLGIVTTAGANHSIFDNTFNKSYIYIWERTQNWRIFRNSFNGKGGTAGQFNMHLGTQGDSYFAENTLKEILYTTGKNHPDAAYEVHLINNNLL
ncbi:hypothetical protein M3226_04210 [Neobacillus cucumis]|uniref:NosD domain-containing protein n=1 Tax=Neobacillus cucumis TaxID=1740721 RepID=UPI0020412A92|nr:hypothetical protein [Neobacillus cucumis]MCM3724901.1 hypothetical protein [Neobacillus cucumis]